ncbi:MAG: hypothetical protein CFE46_12160 [Burkholderiales bacterium PBB6]|nr:MAG: hypothetical protein CFE46_12160 [Burkholderiales bacterium PBB6]
MATPAQDILDELSKVEALREQRRADVGLGQRTAALRDYQHRRFARSHADLLTHPQYGAAARFFLEDLYGPTDFGERDAQFVRIVPAIVRMFPAGIVGTVRELAELHALSEDLDNAMARNLAGKGPITASRYVAAWQATGRAADRAHQLALVMRVGEQLDVMTRSRMLRNTLRLMRVPARTAGLAALQAFLERGFDSFAAMGGAAPFLAQLRAREAHLMQYLFECEDSDKSPDVANAIGQLP